MSHTECERERALFEDNALERLELCKYTSRKSVGRSDVKAACASGLSTQSHLTLSDHIWFL